MLDRYASILEAVTAIGGSVSAAPAQITRSPRPTLASPADKTQLIDVSINQTLAT